MAGKINPNADMGEGFGAYGIGDDGALLKIVRSVFVARALRQGLEQAGIEVVTLPQSNLD